VIIIQYINQIMFIQRNVISSEYTINEYVRNVIRQKLKNNPQVLTECP